MWYALVHDEQLGPMPDVELAELHVQGVISDETLVWTATMSDWRPISEVAEIQVLLADPELIDDEEEEGATMMMAAGDSDWAAILEGAAPAGPQETPVQLSDPIELPDPALAPTEMLDPEPIDDLLDPAPAFGAGGLLGAPAGPPLPAPQPSMPVFEPDEPGEGSIIDRFPDAPVPVAGDDAGPDFSAPDFSVPTNASAPGSAGGKSKAPLIVALVLLLGGGGAAAWYFLGGGPTDGAADAAVAASTDAPASQAPGTDAPTTDAPASVASAEPDAGAGDAMVLALADLEPESPASAAPESAAPESQAPESAAPESAAPESAAPETKAPASAAPATKAAPVTRARRVAPKTQPKPRKPRTPPKQKKPKTPEPKGNLPVQLSRAQIVSVLQRSGGQLRTCAALDEKVKQGTFSVNVVIKRSGVVQRAKVVTGRLRSSPAAKCIEGQVKRFRFGAFTGDPMRIQLPFKL